jgi:Protein of unknown function (DUF3455)
VKLAKKLKRSLLLGVLVGGAIAGGVASAPSVGAQSTSAQGPFSFPPPALGPNYSILNSSSQATNASFYTTLPPGNDLVGAGGTLAQGTQDYVCRNNATGTPVWAFTGPRANLYSIGYFGTRLIGNHYNLQGTAQAGTTADGPRWRNFDGNVVRGRMIASAPGRTSGDIPWLLLRAEVEQSDGTFTSWGLATYITRTSTVGGVAPAAATCTAATLGSVAQVPYSASYNFYQPNPLLRCDSEYPAPDWCPTSSLGG